MELIELLASTSYRHDARGRLLGINQIDSGQPTPRLFLGRTTDGNIWRFRFDLPYSLVGEEAMRQGTDSWVKLVTEPTAARYV